MNPFGKARKAKKAVSRCGKNSFPAGTLVETESGKKPIEEVVIGEKVLAFDEKSGTTNFQPVTDLIQGEKSYRLIEITLSSGKKIEATAEHPFYIKGKGWNPAGSLKVGQVLVLHNGTTVVVEEVDSRVRQVRVYNFSVANAHNYFVGGDGVLVHNASNSGKSARDVVNEIAKRKPKFFKDYQCKQCAKVVKRMLKKNNISGMHLRLEQPRNDIINMIMPDGSGKRISENREHEWIMVGDTVFDNNHKNGRSVKIFEECLLPTDENFKILVKDKW